MRTVRNIVALGLLALTVQVAAETLPDPTRPPALLNPAQGEAQQAAGTALQSVLISNGRRVAIINGKEVRVNDKVGDARVVRIAETEVTLRRGKEVQVLKLFPEVQKKAVRGADRTKKQAQEKGR